MKKVIVVFLYLVFVLAGCITVRHNTHPLNNELELDTLSLRINKIPFSVKREYLGDFENKILEKRPRGWVGSGVVTKFEIGKALSEVLNDACDYVFKKGDNALRGTIVFELLDVDIDYISNTNNIYNMNCKLGIKWMLKDENNAIIDGKTVIANESGSFHARLFMKDAYNPGAPTNVAIEKIANKFIQQVSSSQKIQDFVEKQQSLAADREKMQLPARKPTAPTDSQLVVGKVTSVHADVIELDLGSAKGVKVGDTGRVFYKVTIDGKQKPIYVARFKITHISEETSMAQIEEKTGDVQVGYLVEINLK